MAEKTANIIYTKDGQKVFFDKIISESEKGIEVEKTSKDGHIARVFVPMSSVSYIEKWE